jgi:hypothetical protein
VGKEFAQILAGFQDGQENAGEGRVMPAKDKLHDAVVRALQKANWTIESEQVRLVVKKRYVYLDIQARNNVDKHIILVEVKGFENIRSFVAYLSDVLGQYSLYKTVLKHLEIDYPLYLAVPKVVYDDMLQEELSQEAIKDLQMKLLVFDPEKEEIVLWLN